MTPTPEQIAHIEKCKYGHHDTAPSCDGAVAVICRKCGASESEMLGRVAPPEPKDVLEPKRAHPVTMDYVLELLSIIRQQQEQLRVAREALSHISKLSIAESWSATENVVAEASWTATKALSLIGDKS